ncbi:hypothetical protein [Stenoxybacter acetivorans]|uniref:hypothetical protein n=1 Tax=Stenoxybacter acetivorans TaxID=422441 RepID=UPI0005671B2B|nr:hypothetical protein [Stenoxybacter acetivorans]
MIGVDLKYFHGLNVMHGTFTQGKFIFLSDKTKKFEILENPYRIKKYLNDLKYGANIIECLTFILPSILLFFLLFSWCWSNYSHSLNKKKGSIIEDERTLK